MAAAAAALEEFNDVIAAANAPRHVSHPEDRKEDNDDTNNDDDDHRGEDADDQEDSDEELAYRNARIGAAMHMSTASAELKLPPASFDSGCATGVKGVIADARAFQTARRSRWIDRAKSARRSIFGAPTPITSLDTSVPSGSRSESETDDEARSAHGARSTPQDSDEEAFLQQWRESRRRELESDASHAVHTRRTSPSSRVYGRLDEVDAMGYLDAIEKVNRETKVVVFVTDHECDVSATIESALMPLVQENPTVHFVKVHYDDIEFDPAAVPSILAYHNQGDLFANLTGLIEMMPDSEPFTTQSLTAILQRHKVL